MNTRARINQTGVAVEFLLSFMIKTELFVDRDELCLWLNDLVAEADGAEKEFLRAAMKFAVEIEEE